MKRFLMILVAMTATLMIVPAANAVTINVSTTADEYGASGGSCSLREAITAAQTDAAFDGCPAGSGADVIAIPAGEYRITRAGDDEDSNVTGDFDVIGTGALTIQPASGNAKVLVDGKGIDRVIDQQGDSSLSIRNLQVKGGAITKIEDGGGIRNNVGTLTVEGATVSGNSSAYSGGGIAVYDTLSMVNGTLSGNSADGSGGGLYVTGGASANVRSSTITANAADADSLVNGDGGGFSGLASTVTLVNVINAGNEDRSALPADRSPDCASDPNFFPRYVLTTQAMGPVPCLVGFNPGTSQVVPDAMIGPLADNGGQTPTHALLAGSLAIGTGGTLAPDQCPATDQTGRTRPAGSCDKGAVQFVEPTPPGTLALKIAKVQPKPLKLKRGRKAKVVRITVRSTGSAAVQNVKLCLRPSKAVKKAVKVKGKRCRKVGTLGGSKTLKVRIRAKKKAKKKSFRIKAVLTGTGAGKKTGTIKVKVR